MTARRKKKPTGTQIEPPETSSSQTGEQAINGSSYEERNWARLSPAFRRAHNRLRQLRGLPPIPPPKVDLYVKPRGPKPKPPELNAPEVKEAAASFLRPVAMLPRSQEGFTIDGEPADFEVRQRAKKPKPSSEGSQAPRVSAEWSNDDCQRLEALALKVFKETPPHTWAKHVALWRSLSSTRPTVRDRILRHMLNEAVDWGHLWPAQLVKRFKEAAIPAFNPAEARARIHDTEAAQKAARYMAHHPRASRGKIANAAKTTRENIRYWDQNRPRDFAKAFADEVFLIRVDKLKRLDRSRSNRQRSKSVKRQRSKFVKALRQRSLACAVK